MTKGGSESKPFGTSSMILDTSFLIDVLSGEEAVKEWEAELSESSQGTITSISVMELWEGVSLADANESERDRVQELLDGLNHAAFDHEGALLAGELNAKLAEKGTPIETADVMIAAIALDRDEPVLTRNEDHFDRVEELTVESY